jgi:uncharacterized repeat protein (TIGR02543 family)
MVLCSVYLLLNQLLRNKVYKHVIFAQMMLIPNMKIFLVLFFFGWLSTPLLWSNSSNPPNGYHGETQDCSSCHNGNLNTGNGSISLTGLPSTYTPGQTYDLALTILDTNSRGYGFQLIPKSNGNTSGSLTATTSGMAIESGAAEHRGTSISGSWNFQWTAPATDEGTVTFYASGLATGGTSGNDGDYVYTISQNISANSFSHASIDWNATTGGVIFSSPAIAADGSVYVGSNDNMLHAFNADGTNKWTFETGNWVDSTPSIGPDGTIYVGSWDNKIYALNPDNGKKIWEYETNSYIMASPAIGADGKIYIGSKDSIFYAIESNGSVAWEYFAGEPITSSAALGQDGTIYFGDENGTFHAVNPDGSPKWTYEVEDVAETNKSILSSPALDFSGNIYFGSGNGNCYSIKDNGESASFNWSFPAFDRVDASPVLGINDEVFFVSRDGYLRSLSTLTGNLNWDAFVGDVFYSSPVVDVNGRTYVIGYTGGGENHLFAFDPDGTKAWDTNETDCPFKIGGLVDSSLALSADGKLYYGCFDNRLYCLDVGVGPASSDWPMFQRSSPRDGAWPSYLLEILVSPTGVATTSGQGIYNEGATVSILVDQVAEGYSFDGWSGGVSSTSNQMNFVMSSNISVTANFTLNQYQLAVSAGSGGTVSGSGTFDHGTTASISATPDQGYFFSGWSGQGVASMSATTTTVSMTDNRTVTANFNPLNYSIAAIVSPESTGVVSGLGNYQFGEDVTLTASPTLDGYSFVSWSGDINSTQNPLSITNIDSNLSLTANFGLNTHSLEIVAGTGGTVSGNGNFNHGTLAVINAIPDSGYSFEGWTGDGITDPKARSTTVKMTGNKTVSASFSLNEYSLTLFSGDGGSISGEGNFAEGSTPSITATPNEGFYFSGWTGEGVQEPNAQNTTILMTEDRIATAIFSPIVYTLNLTSSSSGEALGEGNYSHGQIVSITAIPQSGYQFESWNGDVDGNLSSPSRTIIMDSNKSISANFIQVADNNFVLTILSSPLTGGASSGAGSYPANSTVPILAEPNTGYEFVEWIGSGIQDLNSSNTNILLSENHTISANFQKKKYLLQINETEGGSVSGEGNYEYDSDANITALPDEGYTFSNWNGKGIKDPGSYNSTVLMSEDRNISAVFTLKHYKLTLPASAEGEVKGSGIYNHGSVVEISATPITGYTFKKWSGGNLHAPTSSLTTITLTEDTNITASFDRIVYNLQLNASIGGTVSGGGRYYYGYIASVSAIPENGYKFMRWEGDTVQDQNIPFTTTSMISDRNLTAVFEVIPLSENLEDTTEIAPDWYDSAWFGTFFQNENGWAYHLKFGWIYPVIENKKNIWFWHAQLGWVWAAYESFPDQYLWSQNSQDWLLWVNDTPATIRFYDYSISDWLSSP